MKQLILPNAQNRLREISPRAGKLISLRTQQATAQELLKTLNAEAKVALQELLDAAEQPTLPLRDHANKPPTPAVPH